MLIFVRLYTLARILAPIDASGRLCGIDAAVKSRPVGYYLPSASFVCIDKCPGTMDVSNFYCVGNSWQRWVGVRLGVGQGEVKAPTSSHRLVQVTLGEGGRSGGGEQHLHVPDQNEEE